MDTTTKCQHALVIGGLALLLIILACVAFLSPIQDVTTNNVEPVTRVVTYPTGMYDESRTTSKYDRRHSSTRPTRHTQPHTTGSSDDDNDEDQREQMMEEVQEHQKESKKHGGDHDHNAVTAKPHAGAGKAKEAPVAAMYPAAGAAGAGAAPHNRTKRSSGGMNGQSGMKSQMMGQMKMMKNMSMPQKKQMILVGLMSGLTPGQIYAVSMHQYGDMQNGCDQMGPAFNDMSQMNQKQGQQSREKRSLFFALSKEDGLLRVKRSKGISKEDQKEIRSWKQAHNGSLIGFAQANETGYANFSMEVPPQHQEACADCGGEGAMGRGVTMRPVSGVPPQKSGGGMSSQNSGGGMSSKGSKGKGGSGAGVSGKEKISEAGGSSKKQEEMAEQMAKMMSGEERKKRSSSSDDDYQHKKGNSMDNYHHKQGQQGQKGQQGKNMKGQNQMGSSSGSGQGSSSKGQGQAMFSDGDVPMMNQMAQNGTLNGTAMYGYMDVPCACGVFSHDQSS